MEGNENPYSVLGVPEDATESQIKAAYRKLALRHHPDKQRDDESRRAATVQFAKISNAYELLSDSRQRQEFDRAQRFGGGMDGGFDPRGEYAGGGFGVPDPRDDFFTSSFHRSHPFHDPFEVFERVFREEFGATRGPRVDRHHPFSAFDNDDFFGRPMMDPFGGGGMMGGGGFPSLFGGSLFGGFPGVMGGQRGGRARDPFEEMFESMHQQQANGPPRTGNYSTYTVTSTSSTFGGGGGNRGESVTTQTSTRIVNGERQTVTERIVRKADGTVERHVLEDTTAGGARLTNGSSQDAGAAASLPAPPSRRRRSDTKPAEPPRRRRQSRDKRQRQDDEN
jgi:DnaJ domain